MFVQNIMMFVNVSVAAVAVVVGIAVIYPLFGAYGEAVLHKIFNIAAV